MPGPNRPAIEKSGTPGQTGTTGGCTGLNAGGNRQRCQSGTPVHGKADPPSKKAGNRGQGSEVREKQGSRKKEDPSPLQVLIERYLSSQIFSPRTKHGYRARLRLLAAFLEPSGLHPLEITKAHITAYAASLERLSDSTRFAYLRTLKEFFDWLHNENLILVHPAAHLHLRKPRLLLPFPLSQKEMIRILNAPDTATILGLRDRAMLEVLYGTGMRVGELLALKLQDVDLSRKLCFIQKGKGGKGRWVPLTEEACRFVQAYLEAARPKLYRKRATPYVFLSRQGPRLGIQCPQAVLKNAARKAGIRRRVYPHLLRHTAACHLLEGGASLFHVQLLLGHARATSTQRYTKVTLGHLKGVMKACHPRA